MQLRYHCSLLVREYPVRAESLLKNRDTKKDLDVQILSNYSFSNLKKVQKKLQNAGYDNKIKTKITFV